MGESNFFKGLAWAACLSIPIWTIMTISLIGWIRLLN